jgi:putative methionine-R-sulfoxide reductase with GAF domain
MTPEDDALDTPGNAERHLHALPGGRPASMPETFGDLAFGYVDLQALLDDVLERIVRVLEVDTATVLLAETSGSELVARAAIGIEEEVRQGVRIRIGEGFAGRVASEARPLFLDLVDETTVANPILWRRGIRSLLGVPLMAGDQVIGVLHVGSLSPRSFDERDAEILGIIADQVGDVVQVRLLDADRDAAEAIQRSLLPSAPSSIAEFECAARYVPALRGGIGGDWYDVFQLESGDVWLIVGDVAGHGLRAATIMGRIRSAIRAYALLGRGPHEVLELTDRKMSYFEVGNMATAAVAVLAPPFDEALVALAGHPPFAIARPGAAAEFVRARPGPPLGLLGDRPAPLAVPMPRGAVLAGYTDGLIERRGESLDVGLERLRGAVTTDSPVLVCQHVMAAAIEGHIPEDDIALIALRRRPEAE